MKQKDIILIIVVVFVSGLASIMLTKLLINKSKNRSQKVEVVTPISSQFQEPDKRFFNDKSIDPTQNIIIGTNDNTDPFKDK